MLTILPYIKVLTPQRILNYLRCEVSYALSCIGFPPKGGRLGGYPIFVSIEPANFCQLRCPECPVGMYNKASHAAQLSPSMGESEGATSRRGLLDPALFARLLEENARYMHTVIFYFQGEPLLNKELPALIRMAKEHNLYTYLSTNLQAVTPDLAHSLIASGIDRIVASIDGLSEESYQTYRQGGKLSKALQGLRFLHEEKVAQHAHTLIEWQCLRLRSNEHEWAEIRKQYKSLGADLLTFKTAQFYDFEHGNPLMPTDERYSRYKKQSNGTYQLKSRGVFSPLWGDKRGAVRGCHRLWSGCVMDVHGNILPCCFDKAGKYAFGNLRTQSLAEIWHSPRAVAFRKRVLTNRQNIDICRNCTS